MKTSDFSAMMVSHLAATLLPLAEEELSLTQSSNAKIRVSCLVAELSSKQFDFARLLLSFPSSKVLGAATDSRRRGNLAS